MASCKRAPFDLAEAESELVAGFHTEYSGFRWLVIFMAEYGSMFAVSGLASIMFLGGWSLGLPFELSDVLTGVLGSVTITPVSTSYVLDFGFILGNVVNVVVFIAKGWFLVFVMMWVRWTLPRLRIDQVMMTCLKYLLPISCVLLMGVSLWQLLLPGIVVRYFHWPMFIVCLAGAALVIWKIITLAQTPPGAVMPGVQRLADLASHRNGGRKSAASGAPGAG